jgi:excisionase family DNA binding protein
LSYNQKPLRAEYLTTGKVAQYCGVSKVTVLRWIDKGYLQAFRLPEGHYRIHKDDFDEFMEKNGIPFRDKVPAGNKEASL